MTRLSDSRLPTPDSLLTIHDSRFTIPGFVPISLDTPPTVEYKKKVMRNATFITRSMVMCMSMHMRTLWVRSLAEATI